ncbi:MAG: hypothetical protein LBL75_00650 [Rickettsiales bacterium]|jgi:hypothetical protein|nr:hypothetical protein [Rickettsiales bacterium]
MTEQERIEFENRMIERIKKAIRKSNNRILRHLPEQLAQAYAECDSGLVLALTYKTYDTACAEFLIQMAKS